MIKAIGRWLRRLTAPEQAGLIRLRRAFPDEAYFQNHWPETR